VETKEEQNENCSLFPLNEVQWPEIQFETHDLENNSTVLWCPNFLTAQQSQWLYDELLETMSFEQSDIKIFGKPYKVPRLQSWMADDHIDNKTAHLYQSQPAKKWSPHMSYVKGRIEKKLGVKFNYVLINYYRDGNDYINWHSDREAIASGKNVIGSVSLGATRKFVLRHVDFRTKKSIKKREFALTHGSLIMMKDDTQKYWKHALPKMKKCDKGRINLTFRMC